MLIAVVGLAAPLLPRYVSLGDVDPVINRVDPDGIRWLGAPLIVGGLAMAMWGSDGRWAAASRRAPSRWRTRRSSPRGAYAHSRHPIYAGIVLGLAGYTLAWSNWTMALVVGFVALKYFGAKAKGEERWLVERYPMYESYMRQVPRRVL